MTDFIGMILLSLVSSLTYIIIIRSINRMKLSSNRHVHVRLLEAWNSSPAGTIGTNRISNDIWRISERLQQ